MKRKQRITEVSNIQHTKKNVIYGKQLNKIIDKAVKVSKSVDRNIMATKILDRIIIANKVQQTNLSDIPKEQLINLSNEPKIIIDAPSIIQTINDPNINQVNIAEKLPEQLTITERHIYTNLIKPGKGKKIISFSLYNKRPKDVLNAIFNCLLAPEVYPGWICRFYIDKTIPEEIEKLLHTFEHVEVVNMPNHTNHAAMLWRFLPASDDDVDIMISRDADSWLSTREACSVDEWLATDKDFHIIRDHCYHSQKIMGGIWGCRNHILPKMKEWVEEYSKTETYDQGFLATKIYPLITETLYVNYGHPQYDNKNQLINGYFNDNCHPIPEHVEVDEYVKDISFREVHDLNKFTCCHCKKEHPTYIGAILEHMPERALAVLRTYAKQHNIVIESLLRK